MGLGVTMIKKPFKVEVKTPTPKPVPVVEGGVPTTPAPMDVNIIEDGFDTGVPKEDK